jgi:hypothetical protein
MRGSTFVRVWSQTLSSEQVLTLFNAFDALNNPQNSQNPHTNAGNSQKMHVFAAGQLHGPSGLTFVRVWSQTLPSKGSASAWLVACLLLLLIIKAMRLCQRRRRRLFEGVVNLQELSCADLAD